MIGISKLNQNGLKVRHYRIVCGLKTAVESAEITFHLLAQNIRNLHFRKSYNISEILYNKTYSANRQLCNILKPITKT